jgi:hypothetical protein
MTTIENVDLASLLVDANAGERAALELGDDAAYASACQVTRAYKNEIQRRTLECVGNQGALDNLNAALRSVSVAVIQAERGVVS